MNLTITSDAFVHQGGIPAIYTCEGSDISPSLAWAGAPEGTRSLLLIVDDQDAPDPAAPQRVWVHWVLFNLPPDSAGLRAGVAPSELPKGTRQGVNDWQRMGYGGPCPPISRHRYFHKLYALDLELDLPDGATKQQLEAAMKGHVLAQAELMGTYQKK